MPFTSLLLRQKAVPNVDSLLNSYIDDPKYGCVVNLQLKGVNRRMSGLWRFRVFERSAPGRNSNRHVRSPKFNTVMDPGQ